jgi:hypothetical protein
MTSSRRHAECLNPMESEGEMTSPRRHAELVSAPHSLSGHAKQSGHLSYGCRNKFGMTAGIYHLSFKVPGFYLLNMTEIFLML